LTTLNKYKLLLTIASNMPKQTATRGRPKKTSSIGEPSQAKFSHNKKRKSTETEATESPPKKRSKKNFSHLKPRTRRIPQEVISTQWKRLQEPSQRQVRDIFLRAKRTSLNGIRDARRHTEAESAVNAMVRRLEKQLPRMPFPPSAKAGHFNLNEIIVRNVSVMSTQVETI
jgi:kinetochore protein Fta7